MLSGSPILLGDNTIPGVELPKEVKAVIPKIFEICRKRGLDFYPTIIEKVTYDDMSEIAAYGGFPNRYPHWSFGMEYEELSRGYEFGLQRIYELVINTNPCYIYCMDSNTLMDDVLVIAHALAHSDFFKNNIHFEQTDENMMNVLANHGTRIRRYIARWGREKVTEFIDHVLRINTLIDNTRAWKKRKFKSNIAKDERKHYEPLRHKVEHDYMDPWINNKEHLEREKEMISRMEAADELELFGKPEKDIMAYLKDNAPLKPWQQDIIAMLYEEALYFAPQRLTKTLNEGWASYWDSEILCGEGLVSLGDKRHDCGIVAYALHKAGVLGGKYSSNPYALGYCLFRDIKDRWDKGKFGKEYDECTDYNEKKRWNKNLGLGEQKIFEVRKFYSDVTALNEFFTPEFCEKYEFFHYKRYPNGEMKIESRDHKVIKKSLIDMYSNGGLPDIRLVDPNHRNKGWFLLEHRYDGKELHDPYVKETMLSLYYLWQKPIILTTISNNKEIVYVCSGDTVSSMDRNDYESKGGW
jgi:stage V sporulation protein R